MSDPRIYFAIRAHEPHHNALLVDWRTPSTAEFEHAGRKYRVRCVLERIDERPTEKAA